MEGPLVLFLVSKVAANTAFFWLNCGRWLVQVRKCAAESAVRLQVVQRSRIDPFVADLAAPALTALPYEQKAAAQVTASGM